MCLSVNNSINSTEQIIGAKADLRIFMMQDLLQSASCSASLNSDVGRLSVNRMRR
jgi:hypothetical protein